MRRLGKYEALEPVGRGASATVYRAVHRELKAVRALKVFDQGDPHQDRRVKEAVYQSRVDHPGVVRVLDLERDGQTGLFYLVMEFAALGSLRRRLEDGPLEPGLALELGAQMARALDRAHQQKVWHLDLKPDNILFFGPREVKIADFGLARTPADPLDPAWVVGTPNYMAPEQLEGRPSAASDLWALGAMLLEMLTGRLCFPGQSLSRVQAALAAGPVDVGQRLAEAGVGLPAARQDLIQAMLSLDPARRPASAGEAALVLAGDVALPDSIAPGPATLRISAVCARCGARVPLGRDLCPDCQAQPAPPAGPEEPPLEDAAPPTRVMTPQTQQKARPQTRPRTRLAALAAGLLLAVAVGLAFSAQGPADLGRPGMDAASPLLPDPLPPDPAGPAPAPAGEPTALAPPAPALAAAAPAAEPETLTAAQPKAAAPQEKTTPVPTRPAVRTARPAGPEPSLDKKDRPAPPEPAARRPRAKAPAPSVPAQASFRPRPAAPPPAKAGKISPPAARPLVRTAARAPRPTPARHQARSQAVPAKPATRAAPVYSETDLKAMLASSPGHLGARRNLALLYWQQGRPVDAVSQLQVILRARPHDPEAHHALQMILAGTQGK